MSRAAPALLARGEAVSFEALEARVAEATGRMRSLGVRESARVGLWAENSVSWIVIALAVRRAGAVLVPLNTRLADPEIEWQAARAGLPWIIAGDAFATRDVGASRLVPFDAWRTLPIGDGAAAQGGDDATRDAAIVFTSGTTGRPKGAVLTRGNQLASARAAASVLPLGPGDRWLASLPFFHVGGLGLVDRCLLAGACVVIPDSLAATEFERALEEGHVTHLSVVEVTLRRILEMRGGRRLPDRVRAVVVGGGPVSPALIEACPQALATYGLTESCAMVTLVRPGSTREERRTAGRALPGIALRIADDGMIEVRGPTVMRGYLEDPAATVAVLRDGWLRTGDLGEVDAGGSLHVHARREDLIVSGGENIYPAEVEQALRAHPAVADAAVIGVPDARWGQIPLAVVVLAAPGEPDLRSFLAARLAPYKVPRIVLAAELPRLANGKVDRVALRTQFAPVA